MLYSPLYTGLEVTFYIIGIIAMTLWIFIAVTALIMAFRIRHKTKTLANLLRQRNAEAVAALSLAVGQFIVSRLKKRWRKKD